MDNINRNKAKSNRVVRRLAATIVWICLLVPIVLDSGNENPVLLIALATPSIIFICAWLKQPVITNKLTIFLVSMCVLAFFQLISCLNSEMVSSIRYPFYTLAICCFVCCYATGILSLGANSCIGFGLVSFLMCAFQYYLGNITLEYENTLSGILVFALCTMWYMYLIINENNSLSGVKTKRIVIGLFIAVSLGLVLFLIFVAKARTSLVTLLIIVFIYFVLSRVKPSSAALSRMLYFVIAIVITALFIYINAKSFNWYDWLNAYSNELFGKNIDSSRPALWEQAFSMLGDSFIFGLGADAAPQGLFAGKSFHNSYLQLIMTNGLVGLILLIISMWALWSGIASNSNNSSYFAIAVFVGVIIYNCFECTLLSNKLALGLLEWLILSISYYHSVQKSNTGEQ